MNNVKESIGWADYTWNPITGCKRGCSYCYARRIHERFYKTPFTDVVFHDPRIQEKMPKKPSKIFVGSMTDCQYWTYTMWEIILRACNNNPQHKFMFLTKDSHAYQKVKHIDMQLENCMMGLTVTSIKDKDTKNNIDLLIDCGFPCFLSIEPLLGIVQSYVMVDFIDMVIVGAMTGAGAIKPEPEWIQSVKDNIPEDKIHWKSNIKKYL